MEGDGLLGERVGAAVERLDDRREVVSELPLDHVQIAYAVPPRQ